MPQLTDLDALVPDDIVFKYRGGEYTISGDINVDAVLRLVKMFQSMDAEASLTDSEPILREVLDELLALFQEHDSELRELPFGIIGVKGVITTILEHLGLKIAEDGTPDPTPRTATKPPTGNRASRRSSGSRRS